MYPKISFITVVRNNAKGLRATLENLADLHYSNKEIIVIDGVSTDGTLGVIEEFAHDISYFVSEPDGGVYFAMNKGLRAATGDYVWFINAGDKVVGFDALYTLFASEGSLADIYYGETRIIDLDGKVLGLRRKRIPRKFTTRSLRRGMVVSHQSFIVSRAIAPMYDTQYRYSADYDWMFTCVKDAKIIQRVDEALSEFELGGLTTSHHRESLMERFSIMRLHFGLLRTLISHIGFVFDAIFTPSYR